ncbi:MAG TPA: hypothetical protein VG796_06590 [Verrucomicrobiales bacterium]|nr:hypothetical protein [Verrucomicrobiales bacterium]
MTTAAKLIARGLAKGREEGREEGTWIGKIQLLEQLMNVPPGAKENVESKSLAELEQRFAALQRDYDARFKNR